MSDDLTVAWARPRSRLEHTRRRTSLADHPTAGRAVTVHPNPPEPSRPLRPRKAATVGRLIPLSSRVLEPWTRFEPGHLPPPTRRPSIRFPARAAVLRSNPTRAPRPAPPPLRAR